MENLSDQDYVRLKSLISNYLHNDLKIRKTILNYVHNELKIDKKQVQKIIQKAVNEEVDKYFKNTYLNYENLINHTVSKHISNMLRDVKEEHSSWVKAVPLSEWIRQIIEEQVKDKITERVHIEFGKKDARSD